MNFVLIRKEKSICYSQKNISTIETALVIYNLHYIEILVCYVKNLES